MYVGRDASGFHFSIKDTTSLGLDETGVVIIKGAQGITGTPRAATFTIGMVLLLAGLQNISKTLYEANSIDGAGKIRQFFSITLPLIWTNVRTTLTFFVISSINLSFLIVKALTNGGPDGATEVFLSYMYKQAYTNSSYGYGMAIGVVVFLFSFGLSALINLVTRREPLEF